MADKEDTVYIARLAEQAERYSEMVEAMKEIAQMEIGLTSEERNLLSVAYKNVIGARRASWRIVAALEQKDQTKNGKEIAAEYKTLIEKELHGICEDILGVLDKYLIPSVEGVDTEDAKEAHVFYFKMKGDYLRYMAEFTEGGDKKEASELSLVAYKTASEKALNLPPTHAIRLGLALNFSVFYYEILNSPERACRLAKTAFDDAVSGLEELAEESYKDSTLIMQLLRDNLTLWTSDMQAEEDDKSGEGQLQDVDDQEIS